MLHIYGQKTACCSFNSIRHATGFTLLELVIALSVLGILATMAAPSFKNMIERNQVQRIAMELEGFLLQAKSESVMRNKALTIKFVRDLGSAVNYHRDGDWVLALMPVSASATSIATAKLNAVAIVDGAKYKGVNVKAGSNTHLKMDPVRGSPNITGQYFFYVSDRSKEVKVVLNRLTGRLRSCSISGGDYGFKTC